MRKLSIISSALVGLGALTAAPSFAGPLSDALSTCTTDNCQAMVIRATVLSFGAQRHGRWVEQVYAPSGACLRLEVTAAGVDLETVVVDPVGQTFRDDDSGTGVNPRIEIGSAFEGYHTVSIGHFNGAAVNADFTLRYGVYNNGNLNCDEPSTGASVAGRTAK